MATTGFWPVKGRLKDVINYAQNPDKTIERKYLDDDLAATLNYVENSDKTDQTMYRSSQRKQSAVLQRRRTAKRVCFRICSTAPIAVASFGTIPIPITKRFTISVVQITKRIPVEIVNHGIISEPTQLSKW